MNFSKLKNRAGFTLIELIVVIAIMAILAGVAVPVYSGYIEKAEKASDLQLLGAVNTAFAAAVMEEANESTALLPDGYANFNVGAKTVSKHDEAFQRYFAGNEGAEFKSITALIFKDGVFVDLNSVTGDVTLRYAGNSVTISAEDLQKLTNDNTFSDLGADELLKKVGIVSSIGEGLLAGGEGNIMDQLIYADDDGEAYFANLMETLGMDADTFNAIVEDEEKGNAFLANSVVLTAAQKTGDINTEFLGQAGSAEALRKQLENPETATDAMAKLAMTYAMYTSYANYSEDEEMLDNLSNLETQGDFSGMTKILSGLESEEFRTYLAGDGKADLEAYQSAMKIVNDSTSTPEAATDVLLNGFNNEELSSLLGSLMPGSSK